MVKIEAIPAFNDNYIWLLHDAKEAWVVDPGDAQVVIAALKRIGMSLDGILVTHHHFDHVGGVEDLRHTYQARVIAPDNPSIQHVDQAVRSGDQLKVAGLELEVLEVPGHTLDHIAYLARDHQPPLLFCGDTLFAGGCGRVFEGTPSMMHGSLQQLAALPGRTQVYCAHEYTLANLDFAVAVEPDSRAIHDRRQRDRALRADKQPTVPSSLTEELATNPFLRCSESGVVQTAEARTGERLSDDEAVFATIREWKNNF